MSRVYSYLLFFLTANLSSGQTFEKLRSHDLKGGYLGFSTFVDYNHDGFPDIFVSGVDFANRFDNAVFYENNGDKSFTSSPIDNIPRIIYGDASWADFDNNGTLDLLYSGTTSGGSEKGITKIYRNLGSGCEFVEVPVSLPGISRGASKWADIDNDGLLDIFLVGYDIKDAFYLSIFRNKGNDIFEEQKNLNIDKISGGRANLTRNNAKWSDLDADGLPDLLLASSSEDDFSFEVYRNLGDFKFQKYDIGLPKISSVAMEIADMDNDDLPDIVFTGSPNLENSSGDGTGDFQVFTNQGGMSFINSFTVENDGVMLNDIALGDIDNDGYLDAINYGTGPWGTFGHTTKIYKNNRDNTFSKISHGLPQCHAGGVGLGDFDKDMDIDILYYGRIEDSNDEITDIYENTLLNIELPTEILVRESCECDNTLKFTLNNSSDSVVWDFGDVGSGSSNTASGKKVSHTFADETTYIVSAIFTKGTETNTLSKQITIKGLPAITKPDDIWVCKDQGSSPMELDFNLLIDKEILNGASAEDFEVSYYTSSENANTDRYRLPQPYVATKNDENIYARIQRIGNRECYLLTNFKIGLIPAPTANTVDDLVICDTDRNGFVANFDTSTIEAQLVEGQTGVSVT